MSRDDSRPLPLTAGARAVFDLALEGMVWTRRSLLMAALLGLPALFGLLYRVTLPAELPTSVTPLDRYGSILALFYVRNEIAIGIGVDIGIDQRQRVRSRFRSRIQQSSTFTPPPGRGCA